MRILLIIGIIGGLVLSAWGVFRIAPSEDEQNITDSYLTNEQDCNNGKPGRCVCQLKDKARSPVTLTAFEMVPLQEGEVGELLFQLDSQVTGNYSIEVVLPDGISLVEGETSVSGLIHRGGSADLVLSLRLDNDAYREIRAGAAVKINDVAKFGASAVFAVRGQSVPLEKPAGKSSVNVTYVTPKLTPKQK
ncbi:hypothetical protein ACFL54_00840 [Planctomycetota bacterium]